MLNFFARSGAKIEKIDSLCPGRGQAARRLRSFLCNRRDARVRAAATYDVGRLIDDDLYSVILRALRAENPGIRDALRPQALRGAARGRQKRFLRRLTSRSRLRTFPFREASFAIRVVRRKLP